MSTDLMPELKVRRLGLMPYKDVWQYQKLLFSDMVERKKQHINIEQEWLLITQHPGVITLGRHARESNLLVSQELLKSLDIGLEHIERGGDITYHGPGQLVVYPILDLEQHSLGIKDYVNLLEECVIRTIADYGITGIRVSGASGVWIDPDTSNARKICALGVKSSRYITMHGLALNVNTDMRGFSLINPCGFTDKEVTSMHLELQYNPDIDEVAGVLTHHFADLFS